MSTALFYDDDFLLHDSGPFHPENPDRLKAILLGLQESELLKKLEYVKTLPAVEDHILLCHTKKHFEFIQGCSRRGSYQIDPDTHVSSHSFDAAMKAVGAAVQA